MRDQGGIACHTHDLMCLAADLARGTGAAYVARGTHGHGHVGLGWRLTHVTDGDDRAKNRVSAGGGEYRG